MKTVDSLENTKYLNDLSLRLVRLSGNERIRKRIRSAGGGDAFNVLDEIPQLALDHLLSGRSFELLPFPDVEKFLDDEKTEAFEKAYRELREKEGREFDSLDVGGGLSSISKPPQATLSQPVAAVKITAIASK